MGDKHGKIDGEMGRERGIHTQIDIYIYIYILYWVPQMGIPQNGWFIGENLFKMNDFGVPLF